MPPLLVRWILPVPERLQVNTPNLSAASSYLEFGWQDGLAHFSVANDRGPTVRAFASRENQTRIRI